MLAVSGNMASISLKVLEKHTGENMSAHIRDELKAFGFEPQTMLVFTTQDGAANMVKASSLLRSAHFQHCVRSLTPSAHYYRRCQQNT